MRSPLLISALLALAIGPVDPQPSRPVVILVHGRGHLDEDTASLRREWHRDLDTALARAGAAPLRDEDVKLAWYADVMDPGRDVSCLGQGRDTSKDSSGVETFVEDFLGGLAAALPSAESRGARVLLGDMMYAVDGDRRCAARQRVRDVIEKAKEHGRPVVVVAYSLGSLVTYGVLDGAGLGAGRGVALVTLGSPLGDQDIRALLGASTDPLRMPWGVARWENVYDPGDVFAVPLAAAVHGVHDVQLSTRGADAVESHAMNRYLSDVATGEALARALCAVTEGGARQCR